MSVDERIVDKIRKCLALAHGRNATQGEMEVAMAKAKEIAMRHGIDMATVAAAGKQDSDKASMEIGKGEVQIRSQRPQKYHRFVCAALQEVFGIRVVRIWNKYIFIGEATDVAISRELFPWLEDVFYSTYYRAMRAGEVECCAASKNGVYSGLYWGIVAANKRAEEQLKTEEKQTWALIVRNKDALVEAKMHEEFPHLEKGKERRLTSSTRAWNIGYEKGKTINLNQTSNGTTNSNLLR